MDTNSLSTQAFNAGSDARIRGEPPATNPYRSKAPDYLRDSWDRGWQDADRFWGKEAHWPVRSLPSVVQGTA